MLLYDIMPIRTILFFLVARLSGAFRFSFGRKVKGAGRTGNSLFTGVNIS